MMNRILNTLSIFRAQLWPVPGLITLLSAGLAYLLLNHANAFTPSNPGEYWWLYSGEPSTARDLLSALLSGLMTMTSLVVSVTFVILTLSANQLGPRLIGIFMADKQIQVILGLFIGTILYVILILRVLGDRMAPEDVPHLAVTVASLLTILCLLALLFYIHKVARSIIADNVIDHVATGFAETLRNLLPATAEARPVATRTIVHDDQWIHLDRVGYVQVVDYEVLVRLASKWDAFIEVEVRPGHYLLRKGKHVRVSGCRSLDKAHRDQVCAAFTIGAQPTPAQDAKHGIRQLVEIAIRALSPGINDAFTASAVIDRLGSLIELALERQFPAEVLPDEHGVARVRANRTDIRGMIDAAFNPIRQAGADHPAILIHIADILAALSVGVRTDSHSSAISAQLDRLSETAALGRMPDGDRADVLARIGKAQDVLRRSALGKTDA